MSKINLQRGKLTVENRKSREKNGYAQICCGTAAAERRRLLHRTAIDQRLLPVGRSAANQPHAALQSTDVTDRQTEDRRTEGRSSTVS